MPSTPVITIRPATSNDVPKIARIDVTANPTHSLITKSWANPEDAFSVFLPRYKLFFSDPFMRFLVAEGIRDGREAEKEIIGFAYWKEGDGHPDPEYNLVFPESANGLLVMYFAETMEAHKKSLVVEDLTGLSLFISSSFSSLTSKTEFGRTGGLRGCARTSEEGCRGCVVEESFGGDR